jgi:hypothetical protein
MLEQFSAQKRRHLVTAVAMLTSTHLVSAAFHCTIERNSE